MNNISSGMDYVANEIQVNYRVTCKNFIVSYDEFHKKLIFRKHIFKILQVRINDKEDEKPVQLKKKETPTTYRSIPIRTDTDPIIHPAKDAQNVHH